MSTMETEAFIEAKIAHVISVINNNPRDTFGLSRLERFPSELTVTDFAIAESIYPLKQIKHAIGALRSPKQRPGCVLLPEDICEHIYKLYIKDAQAETSVLYDKHNDRVYCLDRKYRMIKYNQTVGDDYTTLTTNDWKFFLTYEIHDVEGASPHTAPTYSIAAILDNRVAGVEILSVRANDSYTVTYHSSKINLTIEFPLLDRETTLQFGGHIFKVNSLCMLKFDNLKLYQLSPKNKISIMVHFIDRSFATINIKVVRIFTVKVERSDVVVDGLSYTTNEDPSKCPVDYILFKEAMTPIIKQLLE